MSHAIKSVAFILAGSLLLIGCNLATPQPTVDMGPAITQTFQAVATQVQMTMMAAIPVSTPVPASTATPAVKPTEAPPTPTSPPVATATAQPTLTATITPSPVPVVPTVHMNENTYCRVGPGTVFASIFIAMAGQDLPIVSSTTLSDYVVVSVPDNPARTCWLWTNYAKVSGDLSHLPVVTPPPTPTPTRTPTPTPTFTPTPTP